jgi:hypothetical protein
VKSKCQVAFGLAGKPMRDLVLKGGFRQESGIPTSPNDYFANVWLVGLRLQR